MNSGNSKTFDSHRLLLNLSDKIHLKRSDGYVSLSNVSIYFTWKNIKNIKYLLQHGMINLNYLIDDEL